MKRIADFVFRASAAALALFAVVFMSVPTGSAWKRLAGIACAIAGVICMLAMLIVRRPGAQEELHLVKRELEHYPPSANAPHSGWPDPD